LCLAVVLDVMIVEMLLRVEVLSSLYKFCSKVLGDVMVLQKESRSRELHCHELPLLLSAGFSQPFGSGSSLMCDIIRGATQIQPSGQ
jgi:hypothetical protein